MLPSIFQRRQNESPFGGNVEEGSANVMVIWKLNQLMDD